MAHTKRQTTSKKWPIKRKGTKFVVVPRSNKKRGIPLLIIIRDILKLVANRKELKQILNKKEIKVNGKVAKDDKQSLLLFDVIKIEKAGKEYQVLISKKGKIKIQETKDRNLKISKVIGKNILKKGKTQINLDDGRNLIFGQKISIGDSVVFNFSTNKIEKVLELKKGAKVLVIGGRHIGENGEIVDAEEEKLEAVINLSSGKFKIKKQNLMVI